MANFSIMRNHFLETPLLTCNFVREQVQRMKAKIIAFMTFVLISVDMVTVVFFLSMLYLPLSICSSHGLREG